MTTTRSTALGKRATMHPDDDAITTELPVVPDTGDAVEPVRMRRRKPVRDIYQRRRDTAAAALLVAGGLLIWSQINETVTAIFGR
jgi:hypothetical protein